jgi:hypothetical protein
VYEPTPRSAVDMAHEELRRKMEALEEKQEAERRQRQGNFFNRNFMAVGLVVWLLMVSLFGLAWQTGFFEWWDQPALVQDYEEPHGPCNRMICE